MEGLQNKKSQIFGLVFILVLMAGSFIYVFKDQSISEIISAVLKVNPMFIISSIILMSFYVVCEGINIWIVMKELDKKTSFIKCIGYGFVGFYFSGITPSASGGQPAQVYFMKKDKLSITSSSLSMMVLLFAHQLVIIVYGVIGLLSKNNYNLENILALKILLVYGFLSNAVILFGILILIFSPKIAYKIVNFFGVLLYKIKVIKNREKIRVSIEKSLVEYEKGARYMKKNPKVLFKVGVVTFFQITAQFAIPYIIYRGFNLASYSLWSIICIQAILNIAVSSLPLPGSVGANESLFVDVFKNIFGASFVIPGMLLTRISNFYTLMLISGIISLVLFLKTRNTISRH